MYERSKQAADRAVVAALECGLPSVFLHPAAVYGPGPSSSPGFNAVLEQIARGRLPALPPGGAGEALARITHRPPLLPRGGLMFLLWQAHPDSGRAQRELGWRPTPFPEGVRLTIGHP